MAVFASKLPTAAVRWMQLNGRVGLPSRAVSSPWKQLWPSRHPISHKTYQCEAIRTNMTSSSCASSAQKERLSRYPPTLLTNGACLTIQHHRPSALWMQATVMYQKMTSICLILVRTVVTALSSLHCQQVPVGEVGYPYWGDLLHFQASFDCTGHVLDALFFNCRI